MNIYKLFVTVNNLYIQLTHSNEGLWLPSVIKDIAELSKYTEFVV